MEAQASCQLYGLPAPDEKTYRKAYENPKFGDMAARRINHAGLSTDASKASSSKAKTSESIHKPLACAYIAILKGFCCRLLVASV